jgi:hypothetical protein
LCSPLGVALYAPCVTQDLLEDTTRIAPTSSASSGASSQSQPAAGLAVHLLSQPRGYTARYPALTHLLPRVGARALFAVRPNLVRELLDASATASAPSPAAGDLLVHLLVQHRRELEVSRGLAPGRDVGSGVGWRRGERAGVGGSTAAVAATAASASAKKQKKQKATTAAAAAAAAAGIVDAPAAGAPVVAVSESLSITLSNAGLLDLLGSGPLADVTPSILAGMKAEVATAALRYASLVSSSHASPIDSSDSVGGRTVADAALVLAHALADSVIADAGAGRDAWAAKAAEELLYADAYRRWLQAWVPCVAESLLHPHRLVRTRTTNYGLPGVLRLDAASAAVLLSALGSRSQAGGPSAQCGDDGYSLHERQIWAALAVARICRTCSMAPVMPSDSGGAAEGAILLPAEVSIRVVVNWRVCKG